MLKLKAIVGLCFPRKDKRITKEQQQNICQYELFTLCDSA